MYRFRILLWKICFPVMTVLWSSAIVLMSYVLPPRRHVEFSSHWGDTTLWLARWLLGIRYEVQGLENLPADDAYITMANHQSTWETAYLPTLRRYQVWILKWELTQIPVFGRALRSLKTIAIQREEGREALKQVTAAGTAALRAGRTVLIFPEGTRGLPGVKQPFKGGGALLAKESGARILPVAHNAGQFWSADGHFHPGTIKVVIGPVIDPAGKSTREISQAVESWITSTRDRLEAEETARRAR